MELKATVTIQGNLLKKIIESPEEVSRGMMRAGMIHLVGRVEANVVKEAPVVTGNLQGKITSDVSADGTKGVIAATAPYSNYVHEGTGIYGPFKIPFRIFAGKNKKALFWPGALHPWRSVPHKGQKPNPFFTRALAKTKIDNEFETGVWTYLKKMA